MTIDDYSPLFTTIRHYSHYSYYSLFAIRHYSLFAIRDYSLFAIRVFQTPHTHGFGPLLLYLWQFSMIVMTSMTSMIISDKLPDPSMRLPVFLFRIITDEVTILSEHFIVIIIQLAFRYSLIMYLVSTLFRQRSKIIMDSCTKFF